MAFPLWAAALSLCEFAPLIGHWLSGASRAQGETIASSVIDLAKKITNSSQILDVVQKFQENPSLTAQFQREILNMEAQMELSLLHDRQKARERDLAFAQNNQQNRRADIMVICAAVGLLICLIALSGFASLLSGEAVGIISTIAGIFGSCLKDAYAFEFGSSRGSKEKDLAVQMMLDGWKGKS
jgi:hypothetical protein